MCISSTKKHFSQLHLNPLCTVQYYMPVYQYTSCRTCRTHNRFVTDYCFVIVAYHLNLITHLAGAQFKLHSFTTCPQSPQMSTRCTTRSSAIWLIQSTCFFLSIWQHCTGGHNPRNQNKVCCPQWFWYASTCSHRALNRRVQASIALHLCMATFGYLYRPD